MAKKTAVKPTTLPLFSFSITNPIEYLKKWWNTIVGNEGIKLTLQIKPLTGIFMLTVFSGIGFGFGRISLPDPIINYFPQILPTPAPSPSPWKDTAYTGKLQTSQNKFYLLTTGSEAITLVVPNTINLSKMVGKRIMAVGSYNKETRTLLVTDATDLEILPTTPIPLPTNKPTPTQIATSSATL